MTVRVSAWLLKEALASVPNDAFIEINEATITKLVDDQCKRRGTVLRRSRRDAKGRFIGARK